jgi:hypothetical protein
MTRYTIILFTVCLIGLGRLYTQPKNMGRPNSIHLDSLQTITKYISEHLDKLAPAGFKKQQKVRREFQQRGYSNVLYDVLNQDGLSALFSFIKVNLHIEYSMPHITYWIFPTYPRIGGPAFPCPDDWSFPENPWKK